MSEFQVTTTATEAPPRAVSPGSRSAAVVAAALSAVFAVSFFLTVAVINVPHDASSSRLVAWWTKSANIDSSLASLVFAVLTALSFSVVANHIQSRISGPAPGSAWAAFARSTAGAFTTLLLLSAVVRGVFGHLVRLDGEPLPGADVLRFSTALNYTLMGTVVMGTLALTVISLAVVERRSHVLPAWHAGAGFVCGGLMLLAALVGFGQFTVPLAVLWGICSAVAIWRTPR
jgi:hypothetical protein